MRREKRLNQAMDITDAAAGTNPHFSEDKQYRVNCQRCVQTYEFRRRGFDVEALPKPIKNNTIEWSNECFVDADGNTPQFKYYQSAAEIKRRMEKAPDGARYIIYAKWKGKKTGSHVFIAEKVGESVRYIDPQTNVLDVEHYFLKGQKKGFGYLRVDNKEITNKIEIIDATMKGYKHE